MSFTNTFSALGAWTSQSVRAPAFGGEELLRLVEQVRQPAYLLWDERQNRMGAAIGGDVLSADETNGQQTWPVVAALPAVFPEWLGDRTFCEAHSLRFPYVAGAMANGIASVELVTEMAKAGMLGFFGAAGLSHARIEQAVTTLRRVLDPGGASWGSNLIHSPDEPLHEAGTVELYLSHGVRRVSAAAYLSLAPPVVRYACTGLRKDLSGRIRRSNYVFAKVSRSEVARAFMSPAPQSMLDGLVRAGELTAEEAALARQVPLAEDVIVEADSGGHTDNRPLTVLLPVVLQLRDELCRAHGYERDIRVGAAGGLGTPCSVAAAFSMGAAFVLTGSVNQAAVESGLSEAGRELLASAGFADVAMAAAADMFELGVKLQVLRRGTMFAVRANRLYDLYNRYDGLEQLPDAERARLEKELFHMPCENVWEETRRFWSKREPREVERAEREPKHKMALCFRWYLGLASRWAISGEPARRVDYQIWCGPAMGAFNDWVAGSFLEPVENRSAVQIARNLLEGAAVVTRAQQLRSYGVAVPPAAFRFRPRHLEAPSP